MIEPTLEQCTAREELDLGDGRVGYACYYPQMGGYCGRALVVPNAGCCEVYVWHDGDFPFGHFDLPHGTYGPRRLHHCDGAQFVEFGEFLQRVQGRRLVA